MNEFKLSDNVLLRIVNVIQEAMLLGIDCVDILRQIRLQVDDHDVETLVLTPEYKKQVTEMHVKLEEQAVELRAKQLASKLITTGDNGTNHS